MENEKSLVQSVVDWMFGGKKTAPMRKADTTNDGMNPGPQNNTMVRLAAEEAARRAQTRGQLSPATQTVLATPKTPKSSNMK